jgi:hypothetical protein
MIFDPCCGGIKQNACAETGGLFRLAVNLMQLFSDNKRYVQMQSLQSVDSG